MQGKTNAIRKYRNSDDFCDTAYHGSSTAANCFCGIAGFSKVLLADFFTSLESSIVRQPLVDLVWVIPAASLFLLIPFFVASVFVEYRWLNRNCEGVPSKSRLLKGVLFANFLSYLLLAGFYGIRLIIAETGAE
jgi:hypothetical protein